MHSDTEQAFFTSTNLSAKDMDEIVSGITQGRLHLYLQPRLNTEFLSIEGAEALMRWSAGPNDLPSLPEKLLYAANWMPQTGLMIAKQMLGYTLSQLQAWAKSGYTGFISVNIPPAVLCAETFMQMLTDLLAQYPSVPTAQLEIEIVEQGNFVNVKQMVATLQQLQNIGIRTSLDDFGAGHSSILNLKRYAPDVVKIDAEFTMSMLNTVGDFMILDSLTQLAHRLQKDCVIEGACSNEIVDYLIRMGASCLQGHAISPPMPAAEFQSWREQFRPNAEWRIASSQRTPLWCELTRAVLLYRLSIDNHEVFTTESEHLRQWIVKNEPHFRDYQAFQHLCGLKSMIDQRMMHMPPSQGINGREISQAFTAFSHQVYKHTQQFVHQTVLH